MKKIWKWLDGKKTTIGATLLVMWQGLQLIAPDLLPDPTEKWIENLIYLITAG